MLGHIFLTDTFPLWEEPDSRNVPFQSSLKTPVMEVILSFILIPFQCSECQNLSTLTVTNVINPQGHRLHAEVAKDSVIKLKEYGQDAPTKATGTRLIFTAEKSKNITVPVWSTVMNPSLVPVIFYSLRKLHANCTLCLLPVYVAAARSCGNAVMAEAEMKLKKPHTLAHLSCLKVLIYVT